MQDTWQFHRLLLAPHRLAFGCGALLLGVSGLWWAAAQLAVALGRPMPWGLPPTVAHGLLMSFGFMPFFFAGFLFTAGPKWLRRPPVQASTLLACVLPQCAGWCVFLLSLHTGDPAFSQTLGAIGLAAVALGWSRVLLRFVAMLRASGVDDTLHARIVAVGCAVGAAALWLAAWGVARADMALTRAAVHVGLWGFVGIVFATVAHRMVPFFSASAVPRLDAWRPQWLLWVFVGVLAVQALAAAAEALGWAGGRNWALARAVVELPAGAGGLALAVRWGLVRSLRIRLLAMLHVGFSWLGVALVLSGVSHAVEAAGGPVSVLGLAPLHAYTMGYLGSTLVAMVTRVSCGHGGRAVAADDFIWRLFWLLQLAIVVRLLAVAVAPLDGGWGTGFVFAAALGWAAVCAAWSLRYGRWFGRLRPDGQPG